MTSVIQGITQFYLPTNTSHTCLYSPATEHHRPSAGTHCAYPRSDDQAELTWVVGWLCSVSFLASSTRGLATPWTYFLHLSMSSVILIDSSTGSPVQYPRLDVVHPGRAWSSSPGIVPCIISFSRQLPCFPCWGTFRISRQTCCAKMMRQSATFQ